MSTSTVSNTNLRRRVVITGMGLISPLGNTPEALWTALTTGVSGVRPLDSLPAGRLAMWRVRSELFACAVGQ